MFIATEPCRFSSSLSDASTNKAVNKMDTRGCLPVPDDCVSSRHSCSRNVRDCPATLSITREPNSDDLWRSMPAFINIAGQKFGRLTALERVENAKNRDARWLCQCDCGNTKVVRGHYLTNGTTKSCGCYQRECAKTLHLHFHRTTMTHGHSAGYTKTPEYSTWNAMIQRCTNPNHRNYPRYGGAGVTVCERWMTFTNFLADMGERPPNTTLGRFGDVGSYCKENCAWQTQAEQNMEKVLKRAAMAAREVPADLAA